MHVIANKTVQLTVSRVVYDIHDDTLIVLVVRLSPFFKGPTARPITAQGNALGNRIASKRALYGRPKPRFGVHRTPRFRVRNARYSSRSNFLQRILRSRMDLRCQPAGKAIERALSDGARLGGGERSLHCRTAYASIMPRAV